MHMNIIFARTDKSNATVALNKDDYYKKITEVLQDTNTYIEIKKDPTINITTRAYGIYSSDRRNLNVFQRRLTSN